MSTTERQLGAMRTARLIDAVDLHVALRLGRRARMEDPDIFAALALAIRAPRHGHVCVDLATVDVAGLRPPEAEGTAPALPEDRAAWAQAVGDAPLVRTQPDQDRQPFHLDGTRLYTDRYWTYQQRVADRLQALATRPLRTPRDPDLLCRALARLFQGPADATQSRLNRQRLAAAMAILRDLTVITGGPGMGKTWTVRNILALALLDHPADATPLRIALAAPSGKAAVRMRQALVEDLLGGLLPAMTEVVGAERAQAIAARIVRLEATTLHRLLGWRPSSPTRFKHDATRPLVHDLVVVDEGSMIDLAMMAKLLDAIGPDTQLVLLGDPHQLASVEAGTVLADICGHGPPGPPCASEALVEALRAHAGMDLGDQVRPAAGLGLSDAIVRFDKNHRFSEDSRIGRFAAACLSSPMDVPAAIALVESGGDQRELVRMDHDAGAVSSAALDAIEASYVAWRDTLRQGPEGTPERVHHRRLLDALAQHRVLCAHRRGTLGASRINLQLTARLGPPAAGRQRHWRGQPILVLRNDPAVGRANGDVGMVVVKDGALVAAFPGSDPLPGPGATGTPAHLNLVEYLSLARLPEHETCFAMTIHKAQGSQWPHITVVLPDQPSPILTRELIYTAITRARKSVTVLGAAEVLSHALEKPIQRASGLAAALEGC